MNYARENCHFKEICQVRKMLQKKNPPKVGDQICTKSLHVLNALVDLFESQITS